MARLKLNPEPTFKLKVGIPVPGGTADVTFTFKYRDAKAIEDWIEASKDSLDVDVMLDMVGAWDLDDEFNRDNMERLCKAYPGAAREVTGRYLRESLGIRSGN